MSSTASPTASPLPSSGSLLAEAARIYRQKLGTVLGYAGWMLIPLIAMFAVRITLGMTETGIVLSRIIDGLSIALATWVYVGIVQMVATDRLHGHAAEIPLGTQIFTVFFVLILSSLLVLFGFALLVLPGLIFAVWFCYAPIVATLERRGFIGSFLRSRELVQGRAWQTFTRLLSMSALLVIAYLLVATILALLYPEVLTANVETGLPLPVDAVLSLAEILLTPLSIIYITLLYLARKNG